MTRPLLLAVLLTALLGPQAASAQEATPVPTRTPVAAHGDCGPTLSTQPSWPAWGLDGQGGARVTMTGATPEQETTLSGYVRPSLVQRELARATTDAQGRAVFVLPWLQGNARVWTTGGCPFPSSSLVVGVTDRVGRVSARRAGPRTYEFSAFFAGAPDKVISLYRSGGGLQAPVLTAQTRTGGEWVTLRRTFLGTGSFTFFLRTGTDISSGGSTGPEGPVVDVH